MYMGNECSHVKYASHPFASFKSPLDAKRSGEVDGVSEVAIIPRQNIRLGADEQLKHEAGFVWDNEV